MFSARIIRDRFKEGGRYVTIVVGLPYFYLTIHSPVAVHSVSASGRANFYLTAATDPGQLALETSRPGDSSPSIFEGELSWVRGRVVSSGEGIYPE